MDELLSGRHVLVVEDEMLVLMNTEDMLADLGCRSVSAAATVPQALALIEAHVFDALMLDMNLKGDSTYSVADVPAARGVPFVFATGYDESCVRERYRGHHVLKKPFHADDLADMMGRLLSA